ncbi:hypothetical protein Q3G72_029215 [Acer saccharum]|nr:hypothetical protein Q3G72_029215 [Acer saccharum]
MSLQISQLFEQSGTVTYRIGSTVPFRSENVKFTNCAPKLANGGEPSANDGGNTEAPIGASAAWRLRSEHQQCSELMNLQMEALRKELFT